MNKLKGYVNVTKFHIRPPCEFKDCNKTGEIPLDYDPVEREFSRWYCTEHAARELTKRRTKA